jgi:alpha-tubulin suppressor-like RCC1 family protein
LDDHKITQLALGDGHVLALADDGVVFSWGANGYFQLGLGPTADEPSYPGPQHVRPRRLAMPCCCLNGLAHRAHRRWWLWQ